MARLINRAKTPASIAILIDYDYLRPDKGFLVSVTVTAPNGTPLWSEDTRFNGELEAWLPAYVEAGARAAVRHMEHLDLIKMGFETKYRVACEALGKPPRRR